MNSNDTSPSAGGALLRWVLRYGVAAVAVTATFTAHVAMTAWVGPGLPTYVTFYPAVIVVAILVGCGPGLVATALVALTTAYWLLPPEGFAVDSPTDRLGLAMFAALGVLISVIAERYRRSRQRAATFERAIALRESVEAIRTARREQFLADVIENAGQAFGVVYPDGRFGLVNRAFEELTGYTGDELRDGRLGGSSHPAGVAGLRAAETGGVAADRPARALREGVPPQRRHARSHRIARICGKGPGRRP